MATAYQLPALSQNRLLASLSADELQGLSGFLEPLPLTMRMQLYRTGEPLEYVYFPVSGVVSAMTVMEDGTAIEVATIGNEGLVGLTAFVGGEVSPYSVIVQLPGEGFRLKASKLREAVAHDGAFRRTLIHYNTAYATQIAYAVACNGLHTIEKRCCRWLLMTPRSNRRQFAAANARVSGHHAGRAAGQRH